MKFTVLVITYNSIWEKLRKTLLSIVKQSLSDVEIVVADDGSRDNLQQKIVSFFEKQQYTNYQLVMNQDNQGTVGNLLSGLAVSKGQYVKFISAGDLLYHEDTLGLIYEFMERHHSGSCFGLLQGYRINHNVLDKVPFYHPFDIESYRKNDREKIKKNLVLYSDNVCGAAIAYELEYAKEYMERIRRQVRYEEDIFQVLAAVENRGTDFLDEYVVWYEVGEGVSTQKNSTFEKKLQEDVDAFYRELYHEYGAVSCVKKRYRIIGLYKIKNLYLRTILRFFVDPGAIIYIVSAMIQRKTGKHSKKNTQIGFLDREDFV